MHPRLLMALCHQCMAHPVSTRAVDMFEVKMSVLGNRHFFKVSLTYYKNLVGLPNIKRFLDYQN